MMKVLRPDTLSYREREFDLLEQPLEAYFNLIGGRPRFVRGADGGRGYAASWLIEDGWLYLTGLAGLWNDETPLTLRQLFPVGGRKVFAAWFTGALCGYAAERGPLERGAPDVMINVASGRVDASSIVHRGERARIAEPLSGAAAAVRPTAPDALQIPA